MTSVKRIPALIGLILGGLLSSWCWAADPVTVRAEFGVGANTTARWEAKIPPPRGVTVDLREWRFLNGRVQRNQLRWSVETVRLPAPFQRTPIQKANFPEPVRVPWSAGVDVTVRGQLREPLTIRWVNPPGVPATRFNPGRLRFGASVRPADQIRLTRLVASLASSDPPEAAHDDFPTLASDGRQIWLGWLRYRSTADSFVVAPVDPATGQIGEIQVVSGPGDHVGPVLVGGRGLLYAVWSEQVDGNWDVFVRVRRDGQWSDRVRISDSEEPDLHPAAVLVEGGGVAVAWQGFRGGQSDVLYREVTPDLELGDLVRISPSDANDWFPALASGRDGTVWVAWDSYDRGNYDVLLRPVSNGRVGELIAVADTPLFEANASVACDRDGRVWVAYDEGTAAWGKDYGFWWWFLDWPQGTRLYERRVLRIKRLEGGKFRSVAPDLVSSLPREFQEYSEYPQLTFDGWGRLWVLFRHRTARIPRADGWAAAGWWEPFLCYWNGEGWSEPVPLADSMGRQDMRGSFLAAEAVLYLAWATDSRTARAPATGRRLVVHLGRVPLDEVAVKSGPLCPSVGDAPVVASGRRVRNVHLDEVGDLRRIRAYRIRTQGKTYRIYRGDLHRHTDISFDGVGDGSLTDFYRYALDAASLDFILVGDHGMGQDREYPWWRTQKSNDMYHVRDRFVPLYGYERSVPYPWGHRNIIWTKRGFRTFPITRDPAARRRRPRPDDTKLLYAEMRRTGGIVTLHTSATDQGTNWETGFDPELEPVVELFQGYHTSYEGRGQPLSVDESTPLLHGQFQAAGYVWNALEKGYWLGFQASSDHIATHNSYACVLAEDLTREALVDAMRKRHTYAATDNIILDVRMGDAIMGDRITYSGGPVRLTAHIRGTAPIAFVEVVRNAEVVYSSVIAKPKLELDFTWTDSAVPARDFNYYYIRVQQVDRGTAWSSPIWLLRE